MPLGRKPRRQESALYLQLPVDSDIHLPVLRSADLHRWTTVANIGIMVKSPAVKTRYRLLSIVGWLEGPSLGPPRSNLEWNAYRENWDMVRRME